MWNGENKEFLGGILIVIVFQVKSIAATLNKIEFSLSEKQDQDLARDFLLQLLHHPVYFTAAKFYTMNYTFLASVR